jgi:Icc-related predicted phosphoesterase
MTLDTTKRGNNVGCKTLAAKLEQLTACRLHVFGHIHEAHGAQIIKDDVTGHERIAVNAALFPGRKPIIVDLKNSRDVDRDENVPRL